MGGLSVALPWVGVWNATSSNITSSTVTNTVTVTAEPALKFKRDYLEVRQATVVPTFVPAYASSCDKIEYASACSCFGVTGKTSVAPVPTSTVTVTTTVDYCEDL